MRYPAVAGIFYPKNRGALKKEIGDFLAKVEMKEQEVTAAVVPHAGYTYCGDVFASVYESIKKNFNTIVILGPNHHGLGQGIATMRGSWRTPLGDMKIDDDFVINLVKDSEIMEDSLAHVKEHSIEVQLPWIKMRFGDVNFVPISVNSLYYQYDMCKKIGHKITEVARKLKRKVLILASSDFTHYGLSYNYMPFTGEDKTVIRKIKILDEKAIEFIKKLDPKGFLEFADDKTICGAGPVASAIIAAKDAGAKKVELKKYLTSFSVSGDASAVVGYSGLVLI